MALVVDGSFLEIIVPFDFEVVVIDASVNIERNVIGVVFIA